MLAILQASPASEVHFHKPGIMCSLFVPILVHLQDAACGLLLTRSLHFFRSGACGRRPTRLFSITHATTREEHPWQLLAVVTAGRFAMRRRGRRSLTHSVIAPTVAATPAPPWLAGRCTGSVS